MRGLMVVAVVGIMTLGCGGNSNTSQSSVIYNAARNVAPAIKATISSQSSNYGGTGLAAADDPVDGGSSMPWYSGNLGGLIFQSIRDYTYPDDEGKVDMLDIYKLLFETGNLFDGNLASLDPITEKAIDSPFDFGSTNIADTYNQAKNGISIGAGTVNMAARVVGGSSGADGGIAGGERHFLMTLKNSAGPGNAYNILQGKYNADTGDLELNFLMLLLYNSGSMSGSIYAMRTYVKGNTQTHSFDLRLFVPGGNQSNPDMHYLRSFIGTGISQGEGNHYLFYGEDQSYTGTPPQNPMMAGYWCFAATDTETQYKQMFTVDNPNGTNPVPDACATHKTHMDSDLKPGLWHAADFVENLDPSHFTGGGADKLELTF